MAAIIDHRSNHLVDYLSHTIDSKLSYLFYTTIILACCLPLYRIVYNDYESFLALGPGGTPSTFSGYLRVRYLGLFAIKDPFQPPSLAQAFFPTTNYLNHLPRRLGSRPTVAGIAPQRQLNQKCSPRLHQVLQNALHSLADTNPSLLREGNSCFEKHGLALFLHARKENGLCDSTSHSTAAHLNPTCANSGEICHLHASDSSMHLTLHPIDSALVIASGWGERHPLAGCYFGGKRLLPPGFTMVYAPREESDVDTVLQIVKAGGWWVGGVDLGGKKFNDGYLNAIEWQ